MANKKALSVINSDFVKTNLYKPPKDSHKSQNGRLTIIGGSKLFHGASLWALKIASRIVDMVYYVSVEENLELVKDLKKDLYDFIAVPRGKEEDYLKESDAVLIGPGLVRGSTAYTGTGESGEKTKKLITKLLTRFPDKKWILDAGALQVVAAEELEKLKQVLITPHRKEFEKLFAEQLKTQTIEELTQQVKSKAREYTCTIVFKGQQDIICTPEGECLINKTGNEGMTKGGTGDVLSGLIAALACKNDLFVAGAIGTYINGLVGDKLYKKVGPYFNASDLCDKVPEVLVEMASFPVSS